MASRSSGARQEDARLDVPPLCRDGGKDHARVEHGCGCAHQDDTWWSRSGARRGCARGDLGDIGTSPIYTVQTVFNPSDPHPVPVSAESVYGVITLIFWSVTVIVTMKCILLVLLADNDGGGGIMALMTLIRRLQVPPEAAPSSWAPASECEYRQR